MKLICGKDLLHTGLLRFHVAPQQLQNARPQPTVPPLHNVTNVTRKDSPKLAREEGRWKMRSTNRMRLLLNLWMLP